MTSSTALNFDISSDFESLKRLNYVNVLCLIIWVKYMKDIRKNTLY